MTSSLTTGAGADATGGAERGNVSPEPNEAVKSAHSSGLHITIHGHPATQGSKKAFIRGKKIVLVEMDPKLPEWRDAVTKAAKAAAGPRWEAWDGAVSVSGTIQLQRPKTSKFGNQPAGPPDLDKLQRAIGDALTKSKVITDDARITHWDIRKIWADDKPGATLTIEELAP